MDRILPVLPESPRPLESVEYARLIARNNLQKSQELQQRRYNAGRRDPIYSPGDWVYVQKPTRKRGRSEKLMHQQHGPFQILQQTEPVNYRIKTNSTRKGRATEIVHVCRMKPAHLRDEIFIQTGTASFNGGGNVTANPLPPHRDDAPGDNAVPLIPSTNNPPPRRLHKGRTFTASRELAPRFQPAQSSPTLTTSDQDLPVPDRPIPVPDCLDPVPDHRPTPVPDCLVPAPDLPPPPVLDHLDSAPDLRSTTDHRPDPVQTIAATGRYSLRPRRPVNYVE